MVVSRADLGEKNEEILFNTYSVFVLKDEKILEIGFGSGYTLNASELLFKIVKWKILIVCIFFSN
jgi:hypothetical protein